MPRVYGGRDVNWVGLELRLKSGALLATIEPEAKWPGLYRVWTAPDRMLSDMVNLTRAKDAARALALAQLNREVLADQ